MTIPGHWQRLNFKSFGQLIEVQWRRKDNKIVFQHVVPPLTVNQSVMKETIATLGIDQDGKINLEEKGYLYKEIFVGKLSINRGHKNLFSEVQGEQLKIGDLCDIYQWCADPLTIVNMEQKILDPGVAVDRCIQHALNEWKWDDKTVEWNDRKLKDLSQTEELGFGANTNNEIPKSCLPLSLMILDKVDVKIEGIELFPIKGGLFKGDYGSHGVEFIRLEMPCPWMAPMVWPHKGGPKGVQGVKITGDPNVPFRQNSFKITDNRPLIIPKQAQTSMQALKQYMKGV